MLINKIKSYSVKYKDYFIEKLIADELSDCKSVLDVGCGDSGSILGRVKHGSYSEGVDIYLPAIKDSERAHIHQKYTQANILDINKIYKTKSFDAVIAVDVIEHLDKNKSIELLQKMEKLAKKKVIVITPNGFCDQDSPNDNQYQIHRCGWKTDELQKLGYTVFGLRGLWFIRGKFVTIKFKPWIIWALISFISEPLLKNFPKLSHVLAGVKNFST